MIAVLALSQATAGFAQEAAPCWTCGGNAATTGGQGLSTHTAFVLRALSNTPAPQRAVEDTLDVQAATAAANPVQTSLTDEPVAWDAVVRDEPASPQQDDALASASGSPIAAATALQTTVLMLLATALGVLIVLAVQRLTRVHQMRLPTWLGTLLTPRTIRLARSARQEWVEETLGHERDILRHVIQDNVQLRNQLV